MSVVILLLEAIKWWCHSGLGMQSSSPPTTRRGSALSAAFHPAREWTDPPVEQTVMLGLNAVAIVAAMSRLIASLSSALDS
jgi:hypothetical protein